MQRLITSRRKNERGASAIIVAVCLLVLVGFGALAVDVGALWSDKKQLQNGADAGALAIAQACASDPGHPECVLGVNPAAADFAGWNKLDDNAGGSVVELVPTGADRHVTVETTSTRQLWLANVLGIGDSLVTARATASWSGSPNSLKTIPIAVSYCQFFWQNGFYTGMPAAGTPLVIALKSKNKDFPAEPGIFPCADETTGAHNEVGGGFGWLTTTGDCETLSTAGGWVFNDPGNSTPTTCSRDELEAILGSTPGKVIHVPLFDATNGEQGAGAKYQITGFAALEVAGYCFVTSGPNLQLNSNGACNGNNQHISATFVGSSTLADDSDSGVDYGLTVVKLTD